MLDSSASPPCTFRMSLVPPFCPHQHGAVQIDGTLATGYTARSTHFSSRLEASEISTFTTTGHIRRATHVHQQMMCMSNAIWGASSTIAELCAVGTFPLFCSFFCHVFTPFAGGSRMAYVITPYLPRHTTGLRSRELDHDRQKFRAALTSSSKSANNFCYHIVTMSTTGKRYFEEKAKKTFLAGIEPASFSPQWCHHLYHETIMRGPGARL